MSTADLPASTRSNFLTSQDIPMQTRTDTPVQSSSISINVDVAGTSNTNRLTLYVGIAVLGVLLILIVSLMILLSAILLSPRKTRKKQIKKQVENAPELNSARYQHYTDVTDAPASSGRTEAVFDDPIYNAPTTNARQDSHTRVLNVLQTQAAHDDDVTAYAISNVNCTTFNGIQEQNFSLEDTAL